MSTIFRRVPPGSPVWVDGEGRRVKHNNHYNLFMMRRDVFLLTAKSNLGARSNFDILTILVTSANGSDRATRDGVIGRIMKFPLRAETRKAPP